MDDELYLKGLQQLRASFDDEDCPHEAYYREILAEANIRQAKCSHSALNAGLATLVVDYEMLTKAVKKAVEVGLFPKQQVDADTYLKHWNGMNEVLHTVIGS